MTLMITFTIRSFSPLLKKNGALLFLLYHLEKPLDFQEFLMKCSSIFHQMPPPTLKTLFPYVFPLLTFLQNGKTLLYTPFRNHTNGIATSQTLVPSLFW